MDQQNNNTPNNNMPIQRVILSSTKVNDIHTELVSKQIMDRQEIQEQIGIVKKEQPKQGEPDQIDTNSESKKIKYHDTNYLVAHADHGSILGISAEKMADYLVKTGFQSGMKLHLLACNTAASEETIAATANSAKPVISTAKNLYNALRNKGLENIEVTGANGLAMEYMDDNHQIKTGFYTALGREHEQDPNGIPAAKDIGAKADKATKQDLYNCLVKGANTSGGISIVARLMAKLLGSDWKGKAWKPSTSKWKNPASPRDRLIELEGAFNILMEATRADVDMRVVLQKLNKFTQEPEIILDDDSKGMVNEIKRILDNHKERGKKANQTYQEHFYNTHQEQRVKKGWITYSDCGIMEDEHGWRAKFYDNLERAIQLTGGNTVKLYALLSELDEESKIALLENYHNQIEYAPRHSGQVDEEIQGAIISILIQLVK